MKNALTWATAVLLWIAPGRALRAQALTQTVRGTVIEKESGLPLIGVSIQAFPAHGDVLGTTTDENGTFRIEGIPTGRLRLECSYIGYEPVSMTNIIVTSGKEVVLAIQMEETAIQIETVNVKAHRKGQAINEMATVSTRQFTVEETDRYAGSRGDPGRMASNFAGVQGADDSRNDIIIRGNSPAGVLWRLNGINIPNPNHFAIPGTSGGPAAILNNKYLGNSDFFTGAFPAEYANSIAGVFDLRMRNGNNEHYEYSAQLGFLGTELFAEGPVSRSRRSSFIASYRYSTLQLFSGLHINVGTNATPKYQDGAFRLHFPMTGNAALDIWGVGGISSIDIILSDQEKPDPSTLLYGDNDRDQLFGSRMGVAGVTYTKSFPHNLLLKWSAGATHQRVIATHHVFQRHVNQDGYFVLDTLINNLNYSFMTNKLVSHIGFNKKFSRKSVLKFGLYTEYYFLNYLDSVRTHHFDSLGVLHMEDWRKRWDARDRAPLLQPFAQYKHKFNNRLSLVAGVTALYFGINDRSFSPFEPRLGLTYRLTPKDKLALGLGYHSQIQSPYLYYFGDKTDARGIPIEENLSMGLTKSLHAVMTFDKVITDNVHMRLETYYQRLSQVPVKPFPSSFSMINAGSGFSRLFPDTTLVNKGIGRNYGIELTVEHSFARGYYYLLTTSLYDSKYKGSDHVWRNTTFNGQYALNALVSKEFTLGNSSLDIGSKLTYAGGRWYGYPDTVQSNLNQTVVFVDQSFNTRKFRDYFRLDLKINYKWNRPRVTHEFALDIVNILGTKNILKLSWAPDHPSGNPIQEEYQLGLLPIFYYKIDW